MAQASRRSASPSLGIGALLVIFVLAGLVSACDFALSHTGPAVDEFALPSGSNPVGITAGPDGHLWFTELKANRIGRITIQGSITEFAALPTPNSFPSEITAGPDGNLWFTENHPDDRIGRVDLRPTHTAATSKVAGLTM